MKQIPDNQLNEEDTVFRSTRELAPVSGDQREERRRGGSRSEALARAEQQALTTATRRRREMRVAHQPARSVAKPNRASKKETLDAALLRERCQQLCVALFFREQAPIRSLGFTSAMSGEGKTFLARLTAGIVAHDSGGPTTLVECNWDHPTFQEQFGVPPLPGLAEWLRGECSEMDIRYQIDEHLFIIPAGDDRRDAVKLLRQLQRGGLQHLQPAANELLIVDLPPILTTGYGALAASLVEALIVVVRAGVTPNYLVKETYEHLKDVPVEGLILNQTVSRIPRWIRQLL